LQDNFINWGQLSASGVSHEAAAEREYADQLGRFNEEAPCVREYLLRSKLKAGFTLSVGYGTNWGDNCMLFVHCPHHVKIIASFEINVKPKR
jgi:hypothetical protein